MTKILEDEDFKRLLERIVYEGEDFLLPIKEIEDPYDFYQVYEKVIELSDNYFGTKNIDNSTSFYMKYDIVSFSIIQIYSKDYTDEFLNRICSIPFNNTNSRLLSKIKSNADVIVSIADFCCILDYFTLPYNLLHYLYENNQNLQIEDYEKIITKILFLLKSLSVIIQRKFYNDKNESIDVEILESPLKFMENGNFKKEKNELFKRISNEYPEIFKTYEQAVNTLNKLQIKNSILV